MGVVPDYTDVEKAQALLLAEVMAQSSPIGTSERVELLAIELLSKRFSAGPGGDELFSLAISTVEAMSRE